MGLTFTNKNMNDPQIKIKGIVKDYKELFPDEYNSVVEYLKKKRVNTKKFAEVKGSDIVQRLLYEIPETLQTILSSRLNEDEKKWFESVTGGRWFADNFREFVLAEKL
jgi:DNA replication protein DnaD